MTKPTIIPNWKYQKPSKGGYRGLKKLLKYVSNRESPDHRPVEIDERWRCPGVRTLRAFRAAEVPIFASTDSHAKENIGVYSYVNETLAQVL